MLVTEEAWMNPGKKPPIAVLAYIQFRLKIGQPLLIQTVTGLSRSIEKNSTRCKKM